MPSVNEKQIKRFWSYVDSSGGPVACWPWTGARDSDGYGRTGFNHKSYRAIRIAVWLARQEDPSGLFVLHSCNNPPCTNPDHLKVDTQAKNQAFRSTDPAYQGSRHPGAKLTEDQVREIRDLVTAGATMTATAKQFGISQAWVSKLCKSHFWKESDHRDPASIPETFQGGERHGMAKLTWDQVREIRSLAGTMPQTALGQKFGVTGCLVNMILKHRIWKEPSV